MLLKYVCCIYRQAYFKLINIFNKGKMHPKDPNNLH